MSLLFEEVVQGEGKDVFDIRGVTKRLKESVERDDGFGATAIRRLELVNVEDGSSNEGNTSIIDIKNSAHGVVKGSGTMKRARSWTEHVEGKTRSAMKRRKKKKVHFLLDGPSSQPFETRTKAPLPSTTLTQ